MSRQPDVLDLAAPRPAPAMPSPAMPSACQSGGCGGGAATARGPAPVQFNPVLVNGVEIAPQAIAEEAQQHPAPDGEAAWMAAARALVLRELMLQEARRLGLEPEPEADEAGRPETDEEALIRQLIESEAPPISPTGAECERWYQANSHRFRTPDLFEASHILIEPKGDDEPAWAAAQGQAATIAASVQGDRRAFAEAARAFSTCPSAQQDGSLGQVRRGELVSAVQQAIEALAEGETSAHPVRSRFGWHVLRLDRRIEGRTLPFEMVQPKIADMLEARSWAVGAARYAAALAARAEVSGVVIDPAQLEEAAR